MTPHARSRRDRAPPGRPPARRQRRLAPGRRQHDAPGARPLLQRRLGSSDAADAPRDAAAPAAPSTCGRREPGSPYGARSAAATSRRRSWRSGCRREPDAAPAARADAGRRRRRPPADLRRHPRGRAGAGHVASSARAPTTSSSPRSATACSSSLAGASGASSSAPRSTKERITEQCYSSAVSRDESLSPSAPRASPPSSAAARRREAPASTLAAALRASRSSAWARSSIVVFGIARAGHVPDDGELPDDLRLPGRARRADPRRCSSR